MQHKFIFQTTILALMAVTIMSFISNSFNGNSTPVKSSTDILKKQIAYVYPNPESGTLNLFCCTGLTSPLNLKVINSNGNTVKTIAALTVAGTDTHKYVQITTSGIAKGEYNIIVSDVSGKTFSRKIFLEK